MENKIIYCGNCGKKGHVYRNCYKPIISLGILCIKYDGININKIINENKSRGRIFSRYSISDIMTNQHINNIINQNLKFLMVCRKHSLGYIELVRGNYIFETYKDIEYIKKIFGLMTSREIENIKKKDFDMLWNDLWVLDNLHESHQKEYEQAKNKFQLLIKGININLYIGNISEDKYINLNYFIEQNPNQWKEPEWEFPKGRRNIKEEDLPCAIREFNEETNYANQDYELLDSKPISEIFMGNNGINYKHTYYLAQLLTDNEPFINKNNIYQKIEISDIKWVSFIDALNKIRDYNTERKAILTKVYNLLYYNIYHYIVDNNLMTQLFI